MRPRRGSPLLFLFAIGALVAASGIAGLHYSQAYLGSSSSPSSSFSSSSSTSGASDQNATLGGRGTEDGAAASALATERLPAGPEAAALAAREPVTLTSIEIVGDASPATAAGATVAGAKKAGLPPSSPPPLPPLHPGRSRPGHTGANKSPTDDVFANPQ